MATTPLTLPSGLPSYAAVWREGSGPLYAGRIELGQSGLCLCGTGRECPDAERQFPYNEVLDFHIERRPEEQLLGGPELVLELCAGPPVWVRTVGNVDGPGTLNEIANFIGSLRAERRAAPPASR